ncbi:hypothetical protein GQ42DRAFT_79542 [Ramicandelaber brevisporus]|nr:hypothetical protein GQ42DRAFT_79542 [Ramicandelaber brevisporus]
MCRSSSHFSHLTIRLSRHHIKNFIFSLRRLIHTSSRAFPRRLISFRSTKFFAYMKLLTNVFSIVAGAVALLVAFHTPSALSNAYGGNAMCCLINRYRASRGLPALRYAACGDSVSVESARLQASYHRQGHYLSGPLYMMYSVCQIPPYYFVQCAAGSNVWRTDYDAVSAWIGHFEHRVLLESTAINLCSGGSMDGAEGHPYFSFDGFAVHPWYAARFPDPCQVTFLDARLNMTAGNATDIPFTAPTIVTSTSAPTITTSAR